MDLSKYIRDLKKALPKDAVLSDDALERLNALQQAVIDQFQPYQGLDPQAARDALAALANQPQLQDQLDTLTSERDDFRSQLENLQEEIKTERDTTRSQMDQLQTLAQDYQKQLHAVRGLVHSGIRPEYEDLLLPKATSALQFKDGTIVEPDGLWSDLKTKYPAMFFSKDAAGAGTTGEASVSRETTATYSPDDGIVKGINPVDVLNGKVSIAI
jgi:TolA-binding protein